MKPIVMLPITKTIISHKYNTRVESETWTWMKRFYVAHDETKFAAYPFVANWPTKLGHVSPKCLASWNGGSERITQEKHMMMTDDTAGMHNKQTTYVA